MEENKKPPYYEDEISLKEMILTIMAYFKEVKRNIPFLFIAAILVIGVMYGHRFYKGYQYKTFINYVIDDQGFSAPLNSLAPVGFQVQIDPKQLVLVATSDEILKKVLNKKFETGTMAQKLITAFDLEGKIPEDEEGIYQLSRMLYRVVNNKPEGILEIKEGAISATTKDKELSDSIVNAIYEELNAYYQVESKEKAIKALSAIKSGKDTLKTMVKRLEKMKVAKSDEKELKDLISANKAQFMVTTEKERDIALLLETLNPGLKTIGKSIIPIKIGSDPNKKIGFGITVGLVLGLGIIIGRKMWRDAMA